MSQQKPTTIVTNNKAAAASVSGPLANKDEAEELPFLAKVINHILTPGSSLSGVMLIIFNVILFFLFTIWMMFVYVMPTSWIVWTFGFLGGGLGLSTNFLLYQILFVMEEPPKPEEGAEKKEGEEEKKDGDAAAAAPAIEEKSADTAAAEPEAEEPVPAAASTGGVSVADREGSLRKRKAKKEN